jgi:hypothetical protein
MIAVMRRELKSMLLVWRGHSCPRKHISVQLL